MADTDKCAGDRKLIAIGLTGTAITALCCFTPVLVILLGILGLSALTGWLDVVLLPTLAGFFLLSVYAIRRSRRHHAEQEG
jgi:mercuric ion transport protein